MMIFIIFMQDLCLLKKLLEKIIFTLNQVCQLDTLMHLFCWNWETKVYSVKCRVPVDDKMEDCNDSLFSRYEIWRKSEIFFAFFLFNTISLAELQSFHTVLINQLVNENATT